MKRVLLVDDDPIILRIYQDGLKQRGFKVETAVDGLAAMKALSRDRPDLVVLDLMMPKLSGVDVLKYVRSHPTLNDVPVVVLSNSYANDIASEATALGVQRALLKVRCSPAALSGILDDVLAGNAGSVDAAEMLAVLQPSSPQPPPPAEEPAPPPPAPQPPTHANDQELRAKTRADFLKSGPETRAALSTLFRSYVLAAAEGERTFHLQTLYRRIHFITASAGLAEAHEIAHLAMVLEALLFDYMAKPGRPGPSAVRTMTQAIELLGALFARAGEVGNTNLSQAQILVVDDDAVCNRLVVAALRVAHLQAHSTDQPAVALEFLKEHPFDLVLLDVEMPGMDGFETCRRLRQIPGREKTPVVYVTSHADFTSRERSIAAGGDDLIGKPIMPLELAVKVIIHLLQRGFEQPR